MARAPVSKTGGWGFESLHSCQVGPLIHIFQSLSLHFGNSSLGVATV